MHATTRIAAVGAIALTAAMALAGCTVDTGGGSTGGQADRENGLGDDGVFTVAAFTAGYATPAGKLAMDYLMEAAPDDWEISLYTSSFDYDKLNSDVQTAITQGADAIFAGFPDPRQIAPLVQAAQDGGLPIFSIDGGVEANDDFVIDITYSQEDMAALTVGALEEALGGLEGKNVMVIGHDPHVGIFTRSNLALDLLEERGATIAGGEMKQVLDPGTGRTEALNFVTDYLQANPDGLDAVWTGWDDAALGAVQAIEEAGRDDIFVTGADALGEAVAKIREGGPFYATLNQDWISVVDELIGHMEEYKESATLPDEPFIAHQPELIDRSNADAFEPKL